jgi:PRTRC genetic system protein A
MMVAHYIEDVPRDCSKKVIYVMQGDGLWEVRTNRLGKFTVHTAEISIPGLASNLFEGWELDVPPIPPTLLDSALSFFREIYRQHQTESHVQFFYDTASERYILHCPKQTVTAASVSYERDIAFETSDKILVLEMHSHGRMGAFFSGTDDRDEKDDRFFGVVGGVMDYRPAMKFRLSVGGHKIDVSEADIFDIDEQLNGMNFPKKWLGMVKKKEIKTFRPSRLGKGGRQMEFWDSKRMSRSDFDEIAKFFGDDYLHPSECAPDKEYYVEEEGKFWFVQDGEKLFPMDDDMRSDPPDEEKTKSWDDFERLNRKYGRTP